MQKAKSKLSVYVKNLWIQWMRFCGYLNTVRTFEPAVRLQPTNIPVDHTLSFRFVIWQHIGVCSSDHLLACLPKLHVSTVNLAVSYGQF